jgi:hypothetical protein
MKKGRGLFSSLRAGRIFIKTVIPTARRGDMGGVLSTPSLEIS